MIDCKNCKHCKFEQGKGRPGKYFCMHPQNPSVIEHSASYKVICSTERRSTEFTIKKTPKWCPGGNND